MNIYCLQTARKGSKSVKKKNTFPLNGKPCFLHNHDYCKKSNFIKDVFITTDDESILSMDRCKTFKRSKKL